MNLKDIIETITEIDKSKDVLAMSAITELLVISFIPIREKVTTELIIGMVVDCFAEIRKSSPTFEFSSWAGGTIIEVIDMLICCGYLTGPSVDMNENSHDLLEAFIGRSDTSSKLIEELEREVECYAPVPNGRQKRQSLVD